MIYVFKVWNHLGMRQTEVEGGLDIDDEVELILPSAYDWLYSLTYPDDVEWKGARWVMHSKDGKESRCGKLIDDVVRHVPLEGCGGDGMHDWVRRETPDQEWERIWCSQHGLPHESTTVCSKCGLKTIAKTVVYKMNDAECGENLVSVQYRHE